MEESQLHDFTVLSKKREYRVHFSKFSESLNLKKNDFVICDEIFRDLITPLLIDKDRVIFTPSNESVKNFDSLSKFIEPLVEKGFSREDTLHAIGGGVIQDVCGFISSVLYRGVDWVFYPTTLLSQGDSCIGGKTSINYKGAKNQIGSFYPPCKVIIDTSFLKTLPENQIKSGLGEMSHYFIIDSQEKYLLENFKNKNLDEVIFKSLLIKRNMIEKDEFDQGERVIFNYGHSFGHALEGVSNYRIPHGIAVANGIDIANYVSYKKGMISKDKFLFIRNLVKNFWDHQSVEYLMYYLEHDTNKYINKLKKDKKSTLDNLGLILFEGEEMSLCLVKPDDEFIEIIKNYPKSRI
jgi:3-dehydroquinate synthase|tara:strand:+ start:32470 stop:33522 length:1053 start_codon:yes stop_codon:yes gene_type:complete